MDSRLLLAGMTTGEMVAGMTAGEMVAGKTAEMAE